MGSGFDKALRMVRDAKALLSPEGSTAREAQSGPELREDQTEKPKKGRQRKLEMKKEFRSKKRELSRVAEDLRKAKRRTDRDVRLEQTKKAKKKKQEIFRLRNELRAAKSGTEGALGALPDFVVIGAPKCGTTFFYHLLSKHPHVEPAAFKEVHFFDLLWEEGVEWYRQCFLPPAQKDGRRTITGDGTPGYLFHPLVAERMAGVIPEARLIALLRNPVDRSYSAYHHRAKHKDEIETFEESVNASLKAPNHGFLSQSIYVDHLVRWRKFFDEDQMLILKSEDFFEDARGILKTTLGFLDLPEWEPEAADLGEKVNKGKYDQGMSPEVRERLEEFFEPHNRRLYEFLGVDFGW